MQDIQVKKQNFNKAKNQLLEFSKNIPETPQLEKFKEDTLWGALSRNVTGKEMNEFVAKVQNVFIKTNETSNKIIKEFNDIYKVFETLDKEYIEYFESSITNLINVNAKAQDAQKDADSAIKVLRGTIEKLNEYKNLSTSQIENIEHRLKSYENYLGTKLEQLNQIGEIKASLEKYQHFMDIDELWADVQIHKEQIHNLTNTAISISEEISSFKNRISRIEALKHIYDVDVTWEQVQKNTSEIKLIVDNLENLKVDSSNIHIELNKQNSQIEILNSHKEQINSIIHLKDVDQLWEENQVLQKEIIEAKKLHQELEQKSNGSIIELVEKNKSLEDIIKNNDEKSNSKITYAYAVGGLALLLVIIQFILNFSK